MIKYESTLKKRWTCYLKSLKIFFIEYMHEKMVKTYWNTRTEFEILLRLVLERIPVFYVKLTFTVTFA